MPTSKGITATLTLDSHTTPLTEHSTTTSPDYASTYIIPTDHARFSITVSATEQIHPSLDIGVWIDGVYQDGRIMFSDEKGFCERFTGKEERAKKGLVKRVWRFGGLDVVDGGECEQGLNVLLNLGTIEVVVLRCGSEGEVKEEEVEDDEEEDDPPPHPHAKKYWNDWEVDYNSRKKKPVKPILESHLKGRDLRHRVTTGKEFQVKRKTRQRTVKYLDSFENPYCILVFEYRSRETLQNMGILPRSSPSESGSELSDEEEQEEMGRLEAMSKEEILRELIAVKKRQAEKAKTKIKQERLEEWEEEREQGRVRKRAKVKMEVVEVDDRVLVDLTDD